MGSRGTSETITLFSYRHSVLGELHGTRRGSDIVQFRGIPFADIPARFRQSVLRTTLPQEPFDATQPGPICPHTEALPFPDFWTGSLPPDGIVLSKPKADEFKCLNLNITAPLTALQDGRNAPVLVFIHGGAFMVGSSSIQVAGREIYDGLRLVQRSIALGRPLVVVTINYRVAPLGFLASSALEAYNKSFGEAVGNYGLHDQRQALEWVHKFIGGFGGDPEMITIQGGSAGGASCHFQALFKNTKVKRAILSSGSTLAIGAMPLSYHEQKFDTFARKYSPTGSRDVIGDLQSIPVRKFVEEIMSGFYNPVIDNDWIKGRTVTDLLENSTSVEFMIGSCAYEVSLSFSGSPPVLT
jgi:carboxylesterase type B